MQAEDRDEQNVSRNHTMECSTATTRPVIPIHTETTPWSVVQQQHVL